MTKESTEQDCQASSGSGADSAGTGSTESKCAFDVRKLFVTHGPTVPNEKLPRVGVVMANLDGIDRLQTSLRSLIASDYPKDRLEIVVVDNASTDGSVAYLERCFPRVRVHQNPRNNGFAPASNQGVELVGDCEILVFLNNDVRVEHSFLRELVGPLVRGECQATGGKLLNSDGTHLDHAGGGTNFQGIAIAFGYQEEPNELHESPRKCLFPSGGAMAISRELFLDIGGFDEDFFAYYEDLDIGWRLWVLGHEVHYVPTAVGYHGHSATSSLFPPETLRLLQSRNPLLTCFKNYDRENLDRVFPAVLALAMRRMWVMARAPQADAFRIEQSHPVRPSVWQNLLQRFRKSRTAGWRLPRLAAADFFGMNDFLGNWDHWCARRETVQSRRKRSDQEIFELFLKPLWCVEGEPGYMELQAGLISHYGLDEIFGEWSIQGADPNK